jgi:hypothetical protein
MLTVKTGLAKSLPRWLALTSTSQKLASRLLWGMELGWTVPELQAAAQVGRPIDTQKYDGMQLKWNMDTDEQVYIGDSGLALKAC